MIKLYQIFIIVDGVVFVIVVVEVIGYMDMIHNEIKFKFKMDEGDDYEN